MCFYVSKISPKPRYPAAQFLKNNKMIMIISINLFKNHDNFKAWKLIKDSGCAGMKIGDAHISEKHCNFFVNKGDAKSSDLEKLIEQVKQKVFDKTGINLKLEIQIIGEKL